MNSYGWSISWSFLLRRCERKAAYNCVAEGSEDTIKQLCDGREQCQINPSTNVFGDDPCPGIPKYVEIQYDCEAEGKSKQNSETDVKVWNIGYPDSLLITMEPVSLKSILLIFET